MGEKEPFDYAKAAFILVAAIMGVHAVVALAGVAACLVYAQEIVTGRFTCDARDRISELLSSLLATAVALWGSTRK